MDVVSTLAPSESSEGDRSRKQSNAGGAPPPCAETGAFEAIIQSADVGILITDPTQPDNPTVFVNPAFERITGYSREDVLGRNLRFLQTEGSDPEVIARLRASIQARQSFRGLLLNRRKDGSLFWNELVIDPVFDRAGRLVSFVGIQNDVTERIKAEADLRASEARKAAVLDAALDAVITVDHHGRVLEVNPATQKMFGYTFAEMLGEELSSLIASPNLVSTAEQSALGKRLELPAVRKDGTEFPIELALTRIITEGPPLFTGHIRDITERRQSEDKLRLAKEEAERASAAKNEFLSRMSHELRTPLNAILGFSQLLQRGNLEERAAGQVRHIFKAGQHLLDLVTEVLDLARIEAGGTSLSTETVEVGEVLQSSVDLVRIQAEKSQIRFDYDPEALASFLVTADRQRLKQVFVNLLSNAVKYNRPGGCVGIYCERAGANQLRISFSDTGEGISPEGLKRLFLPFERLVPDKSAIEGTGIGLAISQRLVKIMDGAIEVRSELGKGTTFSVLLPEAIRPDARPEGTSATVIAVAPAPGDPQTVLYVEDNPANLQLMEQIVAEHGGVRLITTTKGGGALELARAEKPRLILLDLHLPDVFGDTVLDQLRACPLCRDIPIYMVSANAMEGQVTRLLAKGANGYVTKPINVARILEIFQQHL